MQAPSSRNSVHKALTDFARSVEMDKDSTARRVWLCRGSGGAIGAKA